MGVNSFLLLYHRLGWGSKYPQKGGVQVFPIKEGLVKGCSKWWSITYFNTNSPILVSCFSGCGEGLSAHLNDLYQYSLCFTRGI